MASDLLLDLIDGMTRDERRMEALDPAYVKIDERKLIDFLKFMADMASQVNYYNSKNEREGDWQDFFKTDVNILIVLITEFDLTTHLAKFEKLETKIQVSPGDKEALGALKELFLFLADLTGMLAEMNEKLQSGNSYSKEARELAGIISSFGLEVQTLINFNKQAGEAFGNGLLVPFPGNERYESYPENEDWLKTIFVDDDSIKQRILPAIPAIKSVFNRLRSKYNNFLALTSAYFANHDISAREYPPHLALCVTFLKLYQHLQDLVNRLPGSHLDFYYKEILGLTLKKATPDAVHLIFEPTTLERADIRQGEQLLAEVNGKQLYYALNEDVMLTRARITDLKTVFLDEHIQVVSGDHENLDIRETEVYKAAYANLQPDNLAKLQGSLKMWPIMGETQFELADDDRTMDDAEIGILLASPVLFQTEGQRAVCLKLYFEPGSFVQLLAYFRNFARVTGKLIQTVSYELLSDAFTISFTTPKGWEEVKRYSVKINMGENNIEVRFELSPVESGITSYMPEIHGENYAVEWPIVKLLLNNYSTHNPFSFFRKMLIERVTITADVKGSRAVKLQNNIGNLSADNPFQPFGPQPTVGSYLDIKNTNIFNRFTKGFCVRLDWVDLPADIGGWDTYYKEYNAGITNESFKVKLSALSQGKFKPAKARRQEFRLFSLDHGEFGQETLSSMTEIKDIDTRKLELPNRPLLEGEALAPDINFNEGAIRLEFSSPQEAFGSRIYPQIFPDAVMHNAKRFVKKQPLPNAPYVPIAKSILVDYTLEHSEVLIKSSKNEDSAVKIIHQYPFGYEAVYPDSDKQPYHFIPDLEFGNNLYIGIREIYPEQDLTLLFQLEDKNFNNTAKEPEPITWSYLYENAWIPFQKGKVLYDTTNNFINSGIIKLRLPADLQTGNSILPPDAYWLRASSNGNASALSKMIGIYPHAAIATRLLDDEEDTSRFILPANTIQAFKNKIKGVGTLYQLFPSYGGSPAEANDEYYVRVSERLRHKNRLVTNRDIEETILEQFPKVLMAKSISPEPADLRSFGPGNHKIKIIIVPKEDSESLLKNDEPKVNLAVLYEIKQYIKAAISPFVEVEAENPIYEKVKLVGKVKFRFNKPSDDGLYLQQLNEDIRKYLCPWLYESDSSFKIGSRIYVAEILNYIKNRPYVEYITGFSVLHFYTWQNSETGEFLMGIHDFSRNNMNYIRGTVPEAVIIPSDEHLLSVLDGEQYAEPARAGIGSLAIAEELLVTDEHLLVADDQPVASQDKTTADETEYFSLFINHNIK